MTTAVVTQIAYAVQTLFDPAGTVGRLVDLGKLANYGLLTSFTPAYLFTAGVNGTWYDPSDITTLYSDAAGTQPVTAVEQPVGLMLDKSKGLVLGPELVTNGGFDTDTNWTKNGWVISAGVASSSVTAAITQTSPVTLAVGDLVKVTVTVSSIAAGYVYAWVAGSVDAARRTNSVGTFTWYFNITSVTNQEVGIYTANSPAGITIDNVSIQRLPGNHAFNPSGNSANFPVLSARYNLLTKTEDLNGGWTKQNCTMSTGVTDPDGGNTAIGVIPNNASNAFSGFFQAPNFASGSYIQRWLLKRGSKRYFWITANGGSTKTFCDWDTLSGVSGNTVVFTPLSGGWYVVTSTGTQATDAGVYPCDANNATTCVGDGSTVAIYCCKPDLRVANDALNQPAYQRVNTASDYDTVGFKPYLRFDGVNQWLQTNSIDFSYSDKMFVCAGVRKLSDAVGVLLETSPDVTAAGYPGAFSVFAPATAGGATYQPYMRGAVGRAYKSLASFAAPITNVVSARMFNRLPTNGVAIEATVNGLQQTGAEVNSITTQGNYGSYPLYIGARAGTSLFFNGNLHQLVIAGKQASDAEITATETFINQKTGAY